MRLQRVSHTSCRLDLGGGSQLTPPALFNELVIDVSRQARDDMVESEFEYGPRAGLPRLIKMFKKYGPSSLPSSLPLRILPIPPPLLRRPDCYVI